MIPRYGAEDFRDALLALLPTGPVWSREWGGMCWYWATFLGEGYGRNSDRALELLTAAFPATATELLMEWEQTLGLPDACVGRISDVTLRQRLVVDRLVSSIDSSVAFYEMYAWKYFDVGITIDQYSPFRFGMAFGNALNAEEWASVWRIRSTQDLGVLPCIFNRIAPAHTQVLYGLFAGETIE